MKSIQDLPRRVKEKLPDAEPRTSGRGYRIQVSYPFIHPLAQDNVTKAIHAGTISSATKVVREFEASLRRYFGVQLSKACNSGYSALLLALKLAKIRRGDYVLIPAFTMAAVVNAVLSVGAKPTFVDCEEGWFNPSVKQYQERLKPKTTALITSHTYGIPANCLELQKFCEENSLVFIEDIAESIGTEYHRKMVGTFGDFACASLYANKTITAGDGGFILSKHGHLLHSANSYINHGFVKDYHFLHFEFSGNYKMSGLQAAFANPAVSHISKVMDDRMRITKSYRKKLSNTPGIKLIPQNPYGRDAPWMFGVMVESKKIRTLIRQGLADCGIETRNFFFPLHLQPMMLQLDSDYYDSVEELPHAEHLGMTGFCLPTFYNMKEDDISYISECLINVLRQDIH